jgi:hypothetical protein
MIVQVTTKNNEIQKFNYYDRAADGKYVVRFYVDNYFGKNGKKKSQWTGRGCTFKTIGEAVEFGTYICKNLSKANCQVTIKEFINAYADYKKSSTTLEQFLCA